MDSMGDHSLSCPASGMYRRHNRIRDTLYLLGKEAGWGPELEVVAPLSNNRPADVLFRSAFSAPLACDVTVSHPLRISASSAVREEPNVAAQEAETAKTTQMAPLVRAAGWTFRPMGFETTGGMGPGALRTVRQLYRHLSMRTGVPSAEMAEQVLRQLSLSLAKGRGEMLAASAPLPQ